jgi:uncharacterized membrane protein YsdA (DUF1294 family)
MDITTWYQQYYWLVWYIIGINFLTFFFYGLDKFKAGGSSRRISEKTLWLLALIGGSPAALIGIILFRHKTQKLSFQAVFAVILALQIFILYWLFGRP